MVIISENERFDPLYEYVIRVENPPPTCHAHIRQEQMRCMTHDYDYQKKASIPYYASVVPFVKKKKKKGTLVALL